MISSNLLPFVKPVMPLFFSAGSSFPKLPIFSFNAYGKRPMMRAYFIIVGWVLVLFLNGILQHTLNAIIALLASRQLRLPLFNLAYVKSMY